VVTNITHEHLDYHKTYNNYLKAKAKIFNFAHTAIINADDASFSQLKKFVPPRCQMICYSLTDDYNLSAGFSKDEYRKLLTIAGKKFFEIYNHQNTVAASIAARIIGVSYSDIIKAIPTFPGIPGRMESVANKMGVNAIVDFAHTPNALKSALTAAKQITKGKLIVVFGSAGLRDSSKRPLMGAIASELADEIILTAEDPRTEDVRLIIEQIKNGATSNRGHIHSQPDRKKAIQFALKLAKSGDTVIICGKGHEQSMNLDGTKEIPWSDVEVLSSLLKNSSIN
jgi:UDP-N-acetylmuramoyl-L-alanyl-D-glutamate--2,6-diaminopimelate ligase